MVGGWDMSGWGVGHEWLGVGLAFFSVRCILCNKYK